MAVLGLIEVMLYAPLHQRPGWTVAAAQMQAVEGRPCGLANAVSVMTPTARSLGAPIGTDVRRGDFALAADDPAPLPPPGPSPGGPALWHDQVALPADADPASVSGRGTLTTAWYPIPAGTDATTVAVDLAGNDPAAQGVVAEFGTGPADPRTPADITVADSVVVAPAPGLTARQWQEVPVTLPTLPTGAPTAVRLQIEDRVPGADSALAVAPPRLAAMMPADASTAGQAVFADQLSAALWPCVNQVAVRNGIAPTPTVRLSAAENTPAGILANPTYEAWGGTLVGSERTWAPVRVFSAVTPGGPPTSQWGNVDRSTTTRPRATT